MKIAFISVFNSEFIRGLTVCTVFAFICSFTVFTDKRSKPFCNASVETVFYSEIVCGFTVCTVFTVFSVVSV